MYKRMPTTEISTRAATDEEIGEVLQIILEAQPYLEVWLFGSAARGKMRTGEAGYLNPSDLDFLVIADLPKDRCLEAATTILQALNGRHILRPVDAIVWSKEKWKNAEEHMLGRAVLREGKRLFPARAS